MVRTEGSWQRDQFYYLFDKWRLVTFIDKVQKERASSPADDSIHDLIMQFRNRVISSLEEEIERAKEKAAEATQEAQRLKKTLEMQFSLLADESSKTGQTDHQLKKAIDARVAAEELLNQQEIKLNKMQVEAEHRETTISSLKERIAYLNKENERREKIIRDLKEYAGSVRVDSDSDSSEESPEDEDSDSDSKQTLRTHKTGHSQSSKHLKKPGFRASDYLQTKVFEIQDGGYLKVEQTLSQRQISRQTDTDDLHPMQDATTQHLIQD